jgi:hypothetical protein
MGLYRRKGSRFWWMSFTVGDERRFQSTKTSSKEIAAKIWKSETAKSRWVCSKLVGRASG